MKCLGKVQNGVVVLPQGVDLQEEQHVEITASLSAEEEFVSRESVQPAIAVTGLPDDLAAIHDYYLRGVISGNAGRALDFPSPESAT